ncbi:phosphoenolpyruvate synthase [Geobacter sulfurreducens]|uniref:Phosphoenolpyruvate synthase n=1 Tax=Geobacter sulfurreducens (strain ATCC 51573 / DSM 12127 / PCA) TaxID=243231 RepID=Q74F06_GEOSL|nr:phosphoenolpyruvate synthase [Geobacter sulfurreducens]AAR34133.1 phosphoenolpyruvate synthase [Geobacter sulfurreducens PCA]ADI83646.1 phosphoenolpyruvate synthase [Geobacter sulfurreducens KN400]AJY70546.1 phosphoenolpyruvate synthase [Geobacter sulfurreducens]QVW36052.1 phosphoenolpyruvate synthase [Geobacter sulfurreducens]UAC04867.1 phosphoenolpyruvate synthase [Geobacter sulfurreducens]
MSWIRWFSEITIDDVPLVGGKNASLGEMFGELRPLGVRIPNGFAITAEAYWHLIRSAGILEEMKQALAELVKEDVDDLALRGRRLRELVYGAPLPGELAEEIREAYRGLCAEYGDNCDVAVRSSATAEDLPTASFAGQQETYLNVRGEAQLLDACRRCFASLFTDRAISYRIDQGFDHFKVGLSVGVMKMVRSDLASSGVIFTLDTETGFRDTVLITGAWGLGENVVQGAVNPDEFTVFKPALRQGFRPIVRRRLGEKKIRMIYGTGTSKHLTKNVEVPREERRRFCLSDDEVLELARQALMIESHYEKRAGREMPMDIEWAKDGESGRLFIVQARPETVESRKRLDFLETYILEQKGEVLATGTSVGGKIAAGPARVITDIHKLGDFSPGEVLVADTTTPDWEPVMKTAAAIVTNKGGRTCHAAIVSRELGIPSVVGTGDGTERIASNREITVSCAEGEVGRIYSGELPFRVERVDLAGMRRPHTRIMMNLGNPEEAFSLCRIPNDGVGLARMEFIITNHIKIHPMALVHPLRVEDEASRREIARLTAGYADPPAYFVEKLAEGIGTIAAAFHPKPVIVRMSDFKTNEYASLLGGRAFEPDEENPMIGFRGASRYYDERYREGFALECRALKRVRDEMGLVNVIPMIPFCRRIVEAEKVLAEMAANGLVRGENGLEVYVMCEIPNNVIMIDEFSRLFDGFSIGSNDLTQLTLGVDRDSALVAHVFDERDPGVMELIGRVVEGARRNGRHSGICGQAPSDYPEFAAFLVEQGIDSISLNPDSILKITMRVLEMEEQLAQQGNKRS